MRIWVIDAGNTNIKLGRFENGVLQGVLRYSSAEIEAFIDRLNADAPDSVVISSVVSDRLAQRILEKHHGIIVSSQTPLPIANNYRTPQTLGMDRLCNTVAVAARMSTEYGLAIDIGTCIKFDLVGKSEGYMGGSISPGIDLRYRSLNDYTEKLPLLSNKNTTSLVGKDTETSIWSGVINGMNAEIEGLIQQYESGFKHLTLFVTGGDAHYFDIHAKNDIFAVENLTLEGLLEIYKHNA